MTKPNPITILAFCIVALSLLAYTIKDHLSQKNNAIHTAIASKNKKLEPFVAYNPPHGQPGHRHDLPDGALLPNSIPNAATTTTTNAAINNNTPVAAANITASGALLNPPHGQPGHSCSVPVGAPLDSATIAQAKKTTATTATTKAGLNPPHGQPGHRCDIAVGAPLNSAPAKTTSTNTTTTPPVATGLNPPHGQPEHRCDIPVGAPLNSPAKQTTTAASTSKSNSSLYPNYNFPNKDSAVPASASTTPKFEYDSTGAPLNPAHGQPGHDCTIPVGKPLKKK